MAEQHPTDDLLDRTLGYSGVIEKGGKQAITPVQPLQAHPTDQLLDKILPGMKSEDIYSQVQPIQYDPNADWDGMRQAFDAALFGKFSEADPARAKAKKSWEAGHQKQAVAADIIGEVAPGVLLSTAAGQAVFRAGQLAEKLGAPALNSLAKFITGTAEGNKLLRGLSSATWGAGQGAITGAYGRYMGQDSDIGSQAIIGAGAGPLTNMIFAPYRSNVAPEVGRLAREWSANNLRVSGAQLPGAPPVLKLWGKLFGPHAVDMHDVTSSLMRTTGSADDIITPATLAAAKAGIRKQLAPIHPNWGNPNVISDSDMLEKMADALGTQGVLNPTEAATMRKAMAQWQNAELLDRVGRNIGPDGIANPKALLGAVRSANNAGTPVDPTINSLAQGSPLFTKGEPVGNTALKYGGGIVGGALGAEALEHAMPFIEQVMPHAPMLAHAGTAYAGMNALVAPLALPFMSSRLYPYLLTHGGLGPVGNPLLPGLTQNQDYQDKVRWLKDYVPSGTDIENAFITPAEGSTMRSSTPPNDMPGWQRRTFQIESDLGRDPSTFKGSNIGYAQWGNEEQRRYGVKPGDWASEMSGLAKERAYFDKVLGRPTTDSEFYLMHQQGEGGGPALLAGGDTPAWQAIRPHYGSDRAALRAISGNMPSTAYDPGKITARQFSQLWADKFNTGLQPSGVQVRPGPSASPWTTVDKPSQDEISNILAGSQ